MNKRTQPLTCRRRHALRPAVAGAFPKWNQTYLLFVALVPLLWALQGKSLKAAFGLGLIAGLAHFAALLYWIVYVTHVFGHLPLPPSIGILLLLAAYLSLYPALWALGLNWGAARGLSPLWWGPILWVTLEFGQTYIISGFPWELLGNGLSHPMLCRWPISPGFTASPSWWSWSTPACCGPVPAPGLADRRYRHMPVGVGLSWWSGWAMAITAWATCKTWRPGIRTSRWPWSRAISNRAKSGRRRWSPPPWSATPN